MWVLVTLVAACLQASRTAIQHRLRALLSVSGAGFVRYVYGAPVALTAVAVAFGLGHGIGWPPPRFWPIVTAAGLGQIFGTVCLIRAFDARDFAIGTMYSKTEVVQVALFSVVFLHEPLRGWGWAGVLVCLLGVLLLVAKGNAVSATLQWDRAAAYGISAGGFLGFAAVAIRAAAKTMGNTNSVVRALITLAAMNSLQTVMHGGYLVAREREQIGLAFKHWRSSGVVGLLSVCGSACWALAVTLENAAKVRTFGQVELLVTFGISRLWFKHRHQIAEYVASLLVLAGAVVVMLYG